MRKREREPTPGPSDVTPLPFALPEAFVARLGYRHARRLVGVYWEPAGDEVAIDDGVDALCGADRYAYFELVRGPEVAAWLDEHGVDLGSSDAPARHWLLVDRLQERGFITPARAARDKLRTQRLDE